MVRATTTHMSENSIAGKKSETVVFTEINYSQNQGHSPSRGINKGHRLRRIFLKLKTDTDARNLHTKNRREF